MEKGGCLKIGGDCDTIILPEEDHVEKDYFPTVLQSPSGGIHRCNGVYGIS
jgi:hypothetical protein